MTDKPESRLECKYEDWDDTCEPIVCHCMKFPTAQCVFRTDVKQCPNYNPKVLSATPDMEGLREEIAKELGCPTSDGTLCSCEKCQSEYLLKASQILSLIQQSVLASKDELIAFYKMQANSWQSEYRKANEKIAKLEADRDTAISEVTKWSGKAGFNEALLDLANEKISKLQSQLLEARKEIERLKK